MDNLNNKLQLLQEEDEIFKKKKKKKKKKSRNSSSICSTSLCVNSCTTSSGGGGGGGGGSSSTEGGSGGGGGRVMKLSTDPQSVAARQRRHRISERFKMLQSLIPGTGSKMDTVSMLEEAIHYVKFLKTQISLHQTIMMNINFPADTTIYNIHADDDLLKYSQQQHHQL